jgi:copper chaperone CopZ
MATISGFFTLCCICRSKSLLSSLSVPVQAVHPQINLNFVNSNPYFLLVSKKKRQLQRRRGRALRSVAEETLIPEEAEVNASTTTTTDQPFSVSVSPSDVLTMFFQAEGTIIESAIPTVTRALEAIEGITDLKVKLDDGIASVELTKQTTVQATGVASNLVEIIQGSGFKLQTLNLSFEDEEDIM